MSPINLQSAWLVAIAVATTPGLPLHVRSWPPTAPILAASNALVPPTGSAAANEPGVPIANARATTAGESNTRRKRRLTTSALCPSYIRITQPPDPTSSPKADITVEYGQDLTVPDCSPSDDPDFSTFQFTVNGVDRTSYFMAGSGEATGVGVPLAIGAVNTLTASIYGFNATGQLGTISDSKSLTHVGPLVTIATAADVRDVSLCALDCGESTLAFVMPAYVSMDVPRKVSLAYRSSRANPAPVVELDVRDIEQPPAVYGVRLKYADGPNQGLDVPRYGSSASEVFRVGAAGVNRLAVQVDGTALSSRNVTAIVTAYLSDGTVKGITNIPVRLVSAYGVASSYGAGWIVEGVQRLTFDGDDPARGATIFEGDGSITFFRPDGMLSQSYRFKSPPSDFSTLTYSATTARATRTYPSGRVVSFDGAGRQLSDADALGNTTNLSYNTANLLSAITDPIGQTTTFAYRGIECSLDGWKANSLCSVTDPRGRTARFSIDGLNNLRSIQDVDGQVALSLDYDGAHRLTHFRDKRGGDWDRTYDFTSSAASATAPFGRADGTVKRPVTNYASWTAAVLVNPAGAANTLAAPAAALVADTIRTAVVDPAGRKTRLSIDSWGAAARVESPRGVTITALRDSRGRIARMTAPQGQYTDFVWNIAKPFLLDSAYSSATGLGTAYTYDSTNYQALKQIRVAGQVQVQQWGHGGRIDSIRAGAPGTPVTKFTYPNATDPRFASVTDPRGHRTVYSYDASDLRNLLSASTGETRASRIYDHYGRDSVITDPLGRRSTFTYDITNRPRQSTNPLGHTTTLDYDALSLRQLVDAKGQVYADSLDALGQRYVELDPAGQAKRFDYSASGALRQLTNRRGQVLAFGYDSLGNLISRTASDGANATFFAEPTGRYYVVSTSESIDTIFTDKAGRDSVSVHRIPALPELRFIITIRYNSQGQRRSQAISREGVRAGLQPFTPPGTTYDWGAFGELTRMTGVGLASFYYNNELALDSVRLFNGGNASNTLIMRDGNDAAHHLASRRYSTFGVDVAAGKSFSRDSAGRITARYKWDYSQRRLFSYDSGGRLVSTREEQGSSQHCAPTYGAPPIPGDASTSLTCEPYTGFISNTFTWDAVGNPTGNSTLVAPNRLTQYADQNLEYDPDGNVITRRRNGAIVQQLTWNSSSELISAQTNDPSLAINAAATYGYDGSGRRVRKTANPGGTTYFLWDGEDLVAELDGNGNLLVQYNYFPGALDRPYAARFYGRGGAATYYYLSDPQGNVIALVDPSNNVVSRYDYQPFGAATGMTDTLPNGAMNRLRYAGREYDPETGLYYNRARYYDPALGRFVSEDPAGLSAGPNMYTYAGNDPINNADPRGLICAAQYGTVQQGYSAGYDELYPELTNSESGVVGYICTDDINYRERDGMTRMYPGYYSPHGGTSVSPAAARPLANADTRAGESFLSCTLKGARDNIVGVHKSGWRIVTQLALGRVVGGTVARELGVPRVGGVIANYVGNRLMYPIAAQLPGEILGSTLAMEAPVLAAEVPLLGAGATATGMGAIGAGIAGTVMTGAMVVGAFELGIILGSVAMSAYHCGG